MPAMPLSWISVQEQKMAIKRLALTPQRPGCPQRRHPGDGQAFKDAGRTLFTGERTTQLPGLHEQVPATHLSLLTRT